MDDAGVVLLFRDKAYLHPEKVTFLLTHFVVQFLLPFQSPASRDCFYSGFRFGYVPFTGLLLWIWVYILANRLKMELNSLFHQNKTPIKFQYSYIIRDDLVIVHFLVLLATCKMVLFVKWGSSINYQKTE
jgi:hypothetical protein